MTTISDFSTGILTGAISTLIISRFLEPLYDSYIDSLKNDTGLLGKLYNNYSKTIGRIFFLKKNSRYKSLKKTGWEYKIYSTNEGITCYRSSILRLDQNIFKRIQGEIIRTSPSKSSFTSYFKGFIKEKNNYLIWEEHYKNNKDYFFLTSHYKLTDEKDIPGITIEELNGQITNAFSILSFTELPYTSVKKLLSNKSHFTSYISKFNIDLVNLNPTANKIIIVN